GQDYLEGNSGNDELHGGLRNDILVGGAGGDEMYGEGGDDLLLGGSGNDVYYYKSGEGIDTIVDTDGQIVWDGSPLTGGMRLTDNVWRSADDRFTYALGDDGRGKQTLYITKAGSAGMIVVENFSRAAANLSISLSDGLRARMPP